MSLRAVEVLRQADLVLAEDTRVTGKLLKHFDAHTQMRAYHQHNEHKATDALTGLIESGQKLALVSDAGTPGISDPAYLIVNKCIEKGLDVEVLPGPVAFVPALVASGLPCERFVFEGFLPHKKGRQKRLKALAKENRTVVLYESPYRLLKTLEELKTLLGADRRASVSRELSKMHEETIRGSLTEITDYFENNTLKGEFVIVVAGS
jgi:16S rRNA (cytidine1402-2'-O)-methyltransferase